jgi:LacI family transcriptional regulator
MGGASPSNEQQATEASVPHKRDQPTRKRSTIADVAARAGVDPAVISRVVNNDPTLRIRQQTRERIMVAITELNYSPSRTARNLRLARTKIIGLVIPALTNPTWAALATALEDAADSEGRTLIIGSETAANKRALQFLAMVADGFLDGLMIAIPATPELLDRATGLNVVFVNQVTPDSTTSIVFDDAHAVGLALDRLRGLGHKVIAHIGGPTTLDATHRRAVAFQEYMRDHDLCPDYVFPGPLTAQSGEQQMELIWHTVPAVTAVVIANAIKAIGAVRSCHNMGIALPHNLSIISIHDNEVIASLHPAIDAVALPIGRLACVALERLLSNEREPARLVVSEGTTLRTRESTAAFGC